MKIKADKKKIDSTEQGIDSEEMLDIEEESLKLANVVNATQTEMTAFYNHMLQEDFDETEARKKSNSLKRATSNIAKSLSQTYAVSDELNARWNDIRKQGKKRKLISSAPANATIDYRENSSEHFAKGLNIYKLLLICFVGSFAGVVIEILWCLITNGYIESRSGLVYGPFNLLYGFGAAALTVCLYKFRNRGAWISFLGGMIVGSVVEYICSWGQELLFGSRSWDYSHLPFNINGRICLLYSVFWGLLGVLWIKNIYPRMAKLILKIPNRIGKIITWVLVVFFVFNAFVSGVSIFRWSQRLEGVAPSNSFWEFIDRRFPDERMEKVYANMDFSTEK
ncbi:MAG: putative ABC transporter permease [Firmicutes bacterium]|nr:putative ABC transporter permease [Bacillota bacterium]